MSAQKDEFLHILCSILSPQVHTGIASIYKYAVNLNEELNTKNDGTSDVPGVLKIFQYCLKKIRTWNETMIEDETKSILEKSHCSDLLPSLLNATIKSYIIFMTGTPHCDLIKDGAHENTDMNKFVHRCYMEAADNFYNKPDLFWHGYKPLRIKENQLQALEIINRSIVDAVRKVVPLREVVKQYLSYEPEKEVDVAQLVTALKKQEGGNSFVPLDDVVVQHVDDHFSPPKRDLPVAVPMEDKITQLQQAVQQLNEGGQLAAPQTARVTLPQVDEDDEEVVEKYSNSSEHSRKSSHSHKSHSSHKSKSSHKSQEEKKYTPNPLDMIPPASQETGPDDKESEVESDEVSESGTSSLSDIQDSDDETGPESTARSNYFAKYTARR